MHFEYSWLLLSRIPRDSLKHFEISVSWNIRVAEVRKTRNRTTTFNKWICNVTLEVKDTLKILWKRGEIAPKEQFLLFSTVFCYYFLELHVKSGTRISLRDKWLFEISEVETTRVDCICKDNFCIWTSSKALNWPANMLTGLLRLHLGRPVSVFARSSCAEITDL